MEIGGLKIIFKEKFVVKDFLNLQKIYLQFEKQVIDEIKLQELMIDLVVISVNGEDKSEKKKEILENMDSIEDYVKIVEKSTEIVKKLSPNEQKKKS